VPDSAKHTIFLAVLQLQLMEPLPEKPKVTIVTPSYNQGRFIEATIQSVLAQDYALIEYMIVDGGSKDETVEIIKKYEKHLSWWVSEKDQGQTDAINKGFRRASGDILAWINSDDLYYPHTVSEAVAVLQANPDVGMVYADANLIDSAGDYAGKFAARQTDYRRLMRGSVHIPQATTFYRADVMRSVGFFDIFFFFAFDYEMWVRYSKVSRLLYVPRLWADFRMHDEGKSVANDDRCYPDMLEVHRREGGGWLSMLRLRYFIRRMFYSRLPWRVRARLRKAATL
jgi:glycosyltransferase involved in cell wall biosynthesis